MPRYKSALVRAPDDPSDQNHENHHYLDVGIFNVPIIWVYVNWEVVKNYRGYMQPVARIFKIHSGKSVRFAEGVTKRGLLRRLDVGPISLRYL